MDLAVAPESPAVVKERLASPAEEELVLRVLAQGNISASTD